MFCLRYDHQTKESHLPALRGRVRSGRQRLSQKGAFPPRPGCFHIVPTVPFGTAGYSKSSTLIVCVCSWLSFEAWLLLDQIKPIEQLVPVN